MSDLGAIFHVKKNGTQYNAHAYTTLDECPYPNLKIKTKSGTQGYVKLTTNGSGDVPFRVKPKSESTTYQVVAEATPSGSLTLNAEAYSAAKHLSHKDTDTQTSYILNPSVTTITIPTGIKVIKVVSNNNTIYVGVTPNKTYKVAFYTSSMFNKTYYRCIHVENSSYTYNNRTYKYKVISEWFYNASAGNTAVISWSAEINKQTPTVNDY